MIPGSPSQIFPLYNLTFSRAPMDYRGLIPNIYHPVAFWELDTLSYLPHWAL
jgi:hypothetical protein